MQVVHDAGNETGVSLDLPSPIEIDALDIDVVEVAREWENIDLLIAIHTSHGETWIVCIENKVESSQHSNQLRRYREIVERRYANADRRLFIFLTTYDEEPEDSGFVTSSYEVIEGVLRLCVNERKDLIGPEPHLLITQYLALLAEDFVGDSKAAQLARQIYRKHRAAIDFIIESRNDPVSEASRAMQELLVSHAADLNVTLGPQNKGWVRFLPREWDIPQNSGGTAWGPNSRILVCEVGFWSKKAELHITLGKAPDHWADQVWARAANPPFRQEWRNRPAQYVKPYKAKSEIVVRDLADATPEEIRRMLLDWIGTELRKEQFREAVSVLRDLLLQLGAR